MDKPYFVLLNCQNGSVSPLVENNGDLAMFETEIDAITCASDNPLGSAFGFEVFELGGGVHWQ